jgi:hypothetical protein
MRRTTRLDCYLTFTGAPSSYPRTASCGVWDQHLMADRRNFGSDCAMCSTRREMEDRTTRLGSRSSRRSADMLVFINPMHSALPFDGPSFGSHPLLPSSKTAKRTAEDPGTLFLLVLCMNWDQRRSSCCLYASHDAASGLSAAPSGPRLAMIASCGAFASPSSLRVIQRSCWLRRVSGWGIRATKPGHWGFS